MEQQQRRQIMQETKKVHFRDLDGGLKTIVVISWIMAGLYILSFLIGFIVGVLS